MSKKRSLLRTLLRLNAVEDAIGCKKSKIYADIREGNFPAPVKLGPKSVAWRSDEIQQWIDERPRVEQQHRSEA